MATSTSSRSKSIIRNVAVNRNSTSGCDFANWNNHGASHFAVIAGLAVIVSVVVVVCLHAVRQTCESAAKPPAMAGYSMRPIDVSSTARFIRRMPRDNQDENPASIRMRNAVLGPSREGVARPEGPQNCVSPFMGRSDGCDRFGGIFETEVLPLLKSAPGLRPVAIFEELQRRHADPGPGIRRTPERRIRTWHAEHGP
ncbi:MAG: hypothetical protein ACI853_002026 [Paracoccaceae bacterium]|jgi:hypothetical protein